MNERELFRQAFDGLHASEDTYEEVLMKVSDGYQPRRGLTRKALALVLAGVLASGGTAYAITSGFFGAFGSKGREDIPTATIIDDKGGTITTPAMQFVDASEEEVARILGDAVQHVGLSCESHGNTLTIDDLVMDEQGVGVATFTLTSPEGTSGFIGSYDESYPDYGFLRFPEDSCLRGIIVEGADGGHYDHYEVVDLTLTTEDVLHGVIYLGAMTADPAAGLVFGMGGVGDEVAETDGGEIVDRESWDALTDAFVPSVRVTGPELKSEEGYLAHVSPLGITFAAPFGELAIDAWVPGGTTLQMSDGSTYVVEDDDNLNTYCSYYTEEGALTLVFNRLVDPAQVTGVTIGDPGGEPLEFSPAG